MQKIIVAPYTKEWNEMFCLETDHLTKVFEGLSISFHHIGSTSIPGCDAKPIIDILGVTPDILQIDAYNPKLEKLGYASLGEFGMNQRRFFRKNNQVHLHIFEDSDPEVARHLRFRDFLIAHPEKMKEYVHLKQKLAIDYQTEREKYVLGKEQFVKSIDCAAVCQDTGSYWNKQLYPRRATWTNQELVHAMEVNMQLHMTYFAKYLPEMQIVYEPDVVVVQSSIKDDTFNYVIGAKFSEKNLSQRVKHVLTLFRARHLPFTWWVSESDTPANLANELLAQGLVLQSDEIGMTLSLDHLQFSRQNPALSIQRAYDKVGLKDFATVMMSLGGFENVYEQLFDKIPPVLYSEGAPFEMYVGYIDAIPVVTGILVLHANVGGIYYIMTHPAYRKKGYATEMMLELLDRAKTQGYHIASLQASLSGRNLYQRLGFQSLCRFIEYG